MDLPALRDVTVEPGQLTGGYSTLRYTPEVEGGAVAAGLGNVASVGDNVMQFMKAKYDSLAVTAASNQRSTILNKLLSDPNTGLLYMRGKDALAVPGKFEDGYKDAVDNIVGTLANISQKTEFLRQSAQERDYRQMQIDRHVSSEMQSFDDQATRTAVANAQDLAIKNADHPDIIGGAIDTMRGVILAQGKRMGWDPDTTDYMLRKAASDTHVGVIDELLTDGKATQAQLYYDHMKNDIDGVEQPKVEKALQEGNIRVRSAQDASDIITKNPNDYEAQVEAARAIKDPLEQDATMDRLKQNNELRESILDAQHKDAVRTAGAVVSAGHGTDAVPPKVWAELTPEEQVAMQKNARTLATGQEPINDYKRWTDFVNNVANDPGSIAKMDLYTTMRPYLDNAHYNQAVAMQKAAMQAAGGDKTTLTSVQSPIQQYNSTVFPIAFPGVKTPAALSGDDKARNGELMSKVTGEINALEAATGKKLTPDQRQKVMDDFVHREVFVHNTLLPETLFKPNQVSTASISKDDMGRAFVPLASIPKDAVDNIKAYAKSIGRTLSDDDIERAYAAQLVNE